MDPGTTLLSLIVGELIFLYFLYLQALLSITYGVLIHFVMKECLSDPRSFNKSQ